MKKILLAIVIILVIGAVGLFFGLNAIIKKSVETALPAVTGTPVTLDSANLSILSGKGTLRGFVIGNPEGFKTQSAFDLKKIHVALDLGSLLSDTIVIDEIHIDAPALTYEQALHGSNIGKIQDNVEKFSGPGDKKEAAPAPESEESTSKKVVIGHFLFENGSLEISSSALGGQSVSVPMGKIELRDIGKESGGATLAEVSRQVFGSVSTMVESAAAQGKELIKKGAAVAKDAAKQIVADGKDRGNESVESARKEADSQVDKVKGLFGGKEK